MSDCFKVCNESKDFPAISKRLSKESSLQMYTLLRSPSFNQGSSKCMYTTFSPKLTFGTPPPPPETHTCVYLEVKNIGFSEDVAYVGN